MSTRMWIFRGACLICCCILATVVVVAFVEIAAYHAIADMTGCNLGQLWFACGDGWGGRLIAPVLNLPALFSYAREFTFAPLGGSQMRREFMLSLYLCDLVFALALTYPLLLLFSRKGNDQENQ